MQGVNWVAFSVFLLLFGFITWLGFAAARYRKMGIDFISSPFDETARRRVAEILGEAACARLRAEGALWDDEETIECLRTVAAGAGTGLGRPQK